MIKYIENPSLEVQLGAIRRYAFAIEYIKTPSPEVQFAAVKKNGNAIMYVENTSLDIQLAAVGQTGYAIECIQNPSSIVCELSKLIHQYEYRGEISIEYSELSPELCKYIEENLPYLLNYIPGVPGYLKLFSEPKVYKSDYWDTDLIFKYRN